MKNRFGFNGLIAVLALLVLCAVSACEKDTDKDKDPVITPKGTLMFHLHNYVSESEVDAYGITYTSDAGRQISLSMSQFYLSGIYLIREDGSRYDLTGATIIKTLDKQTYTIAEVPVGTYKTLGFDVGLGADTSSKSPSAVSGDVLNRPEMWFGATAQPEGYIYFNAQGMIDVRADVENGVADMQPFNYKIGSDARLVPVVMPQQTLVVAENQHPYAHLLVDYSRLFNGLDLSNNASLHVDTKADNSSSVANTISSNIASMFIYED